LRTRERGTSRMSASPLPLSSAIAQILVVRRIAGVTMR
jgi:hypothetical protein